jgi:hypothetical protein
VGPQGHRVHRLRAERHDEPAQARRLHVPARAHRPDPRPDPGRRGAGGIGRVRRLSRGAAKECSPRREPWFDTIAM